MDQTYFPQDEGHPNMPGQQLGQQDADVELANFELRNMNLGVLHHDPYDFGGYNQNATGLGNIMDYANYANYNPNFAQEINMQAEAAEPNRNLMEQHKFPIVKANMELRKKEFWKITEDTMFTDLVIVAGYEDSERSFPLHRAIFAHYSGWLAKLCDPDKPLWRQQQVSLRVRNIDPDTFDRVRSWVYLKEGVLDDISMEMASNLLAAAEALDIANLKHDLLWVVFHATESQVNPDLGFLTSVFNFLNLAFRINNDEVGHNLVTECLRKFLSKCSVYQLHKFWITNELMCERFKEQFLHFISTTTCTF
ncbi:hypothetical protein TWF225_000515 [Orbilia oligospora]|uniref:Uncharacterized protein n=1 Tax=Orbilia oligospora TaxID=2813651 RepID=A0A7C8PRF3_ORBOL|nr:hypothetical protein TWF751_003151 [Orbilia oligospora]KAF3192255.1 hypothetical protein TWF225_000515 [Orbilia oligospora]KAF3264579.1 hypothetical protein TWF128_001045 [Orbilia oligospora]KAF3268369.1 hypothetical protein TWF217_010963 [Orbilia oligospora]KAF3290385.1 hypothetical protein TWF132_006952 [Orbilia oligospora]